MDRRVVDEDGVPEGFGISRRSLLARSGGIAGALVSTSGLAALLAACGDEEAATGGASSETLKRIAQLKAAVLSEPDILDPQKSAVYAAAEVYDHVFSKLISVDEKGEFVPRLATKWKMQDDRTWVFDLRESVTFHNGEPFTADDVKYTIERMLAKKTASSYAANFASVESVEVVSPTRVVFHLSVPYAPFLTALANNGQIVNKTAIEASGSGRNPVGTGPFKFVRWVRGDYVLLERFDDYFEPGVPLPGELRIRFFGSSAQRIDAVRAGELDWVDAIPPESLAAVKSDSAFNYVTANTAGLPQFLMFNTTKPPFDNKAVRQAVAWAIDREQIRQVAFLGAGETGSEEVPTGSSWYDGQDPYRDGPDLDKARALMKEAGVGNITVKYNAWTTAPYPAKVGEVLREQLKEIGIDLKIEQMEISIWVEQLFSKGYELTIGFNERTVDPDNLYGLLLQSDSSQNVFGYANKQFDALVDKARAESDVSRREELYADVRQLIFDDVPLYYVHYDTVSYLMRSNIGGSVVRPNLELGLQYVGVKE